MIINHNIAALNTYRQLTTNNASSQKSLEKLSSGLRINRAGDDAAGLAISEKMRAQIRGLDQASRNAQDSISLIQTSEGAMNETHSILQRMRELAVQASNDTNVSVDRDEIQKEINQLTSEINRIGNTTEFNTQKLLNGDKANTFTVTGTSFSGATTKTMLGMTAGLTTGTAGLSSGSYKVVVTKVSSGTTVSGATTSGLNVGTTLKPMAADIVTGTTKPTFDATGITVTSGAAGDTNWLSNGSYSGKELSITVGSDSGGKYITVTLKGSGYETVDKHYASGNSVSYNEHGVSFTITSLSGWSSGDAVTFDGGSGSFTSRTIGTNEQFWDTVVIDPGGAPATFAGSGIKVDSGVADGNWTISITTDGSGNVTAITVQLSGATSSGDFTNIISGAALSGAIGGKYNAHGISFDLTDVGDLKSGTHIIKFETEKPVTAPSTTTYKNTYSAQLQTASGAAVGSAVVIGSASGASSSGAALNVSGSITIGNGGLTLGFVSSTAIVLGSGAVFNVTPTTAGKDNSLSFQIGANQNQVMNLSIEDMRSKALGISSNAAGAGFTGSAVVTNSGTEAVEFALNVTTSSGASSAISVINKAIETVSSERSKLGAVQNRLEHTINNLGTSAENLQAAESRVRDVDMARVMMEFTKDGILQQAAQAMLAQANQQPQGVLQLLR